MFKFFAMLFAIHFSPVRRSLGRSVGRSVVVSNYRSFEACELVAVVVHKLILASSISERMKLEVNFIYMHDGAQSQFSPEIDRKLKKLRRVFSKIYRELPRKRLVFL